MNFVARAALVRDAATIAAIYNEGIVDRIATFETEPRSPEQIKAWFDGLHPVIVVEGVDATVVAFASNSKYRDRACYAGIAEFSVYVGRSYRGTGAGHVAMTALIDAATKAGFVKLVSRISPENAPSVTLMVRPLGRCRSPVSGAFWIIAWLGRLARASPTIKHGS